MVLFFKKKGYKHFANSGKPVHRHVAERKLGRKLKPGEVVHHRDGNKLNNKRGNLAVLSRKFHSKLHHKKRKGEWFW